MHLAKTHLVLDKGQRAVMVFSWEVNHRLLSMGFKEHDTKIHTWPTGYSCKCYKALCLFTNLLSTFLAEIIPELVNKISKIQNVKERI